MFDYLSSYDRDILIRHIERRNIAHAYLFYGAEEENLDTTVLEFIKTVFCENSRYYCDRCIECEKIEKNENPDVTHVRRDGKNIRIRQIRNLQYEASLSPSEYEYNIFVIHMCEDMTQEAANAFLKTLEEPEENTVMILTASSRDSVLPTILSRCILIKVKDESADENLMESEMIYILETVREIAGSDSMNLMNASQKLSKDRLKATGYILFLMRFFTDVLLFKETDAPVRERFSGYLDFVSDFNSRVPAENLNRLINRSMEIYEAVQYNVNMKSAFINLLLDVEEASKV